MKTNARLALLSVLLASAVAAPAAFAEKANGDINFAFRFNRSAPAEKTYADLKREAREACAYPDPRRYLDRIVRDCADRLIEKAVNQIGDSRIAALHGRNIRQASAGSAISGS